jgi:hypothetical protein
MTMQLSRLQKASLIILFIEKLKENGSWGGETHVQKAMYFLQHMTEIPMGFTFILYKHGPFSFDFRDELAGMFADALLENEIIAFSYGPSLNPTPAGKRIRDHFFDSIQIYQNKLDFVAKYLGNKGVVELERMGTALYVTLEEEGLGQETRSNRIIQLKPHIKLDEAREAVHQVDEMKNSFEQNF